MHCMEPGENINWLAQVRRGVAEHCVLALLTSGERYGFELARELGARGQIIASEGTLTRCWPVCGVTASWRRRGGSQPLGRRAATTTSRGTENWPSPASRNSGGYLATPFTRSSTKGARSDFQTNRRRGRQTRPALYGAAGRSAAGRRRLPEGGDPRRSARAHRRGADRTRSRRRSECPDPPRQGWRPCCHRRRGRRPPPGSGRWDAWAPWPIIFGFIASGLGWIAGVVILWTSPTWSQRDKLIATFVPLAGLVALFFGLVAALRAAAGCPGTVTALHASAGCTTKGPTLPLGVAILLVVAGLAAHLLPPIHLMRRRRQQRSTFA